MTRESLDLRDDAFHRFSTFPAYLEMMRRKFRDETVAGIRDMTGHVLDRLYASS
jgi:hypothetical protein